MLPYLKHCCPAGNSCDFVAGGCTQQAELTWITFYSETRQGNWLMDKRLSYIFYKWSISLFSFSILIYVCFSEQSTSLSFLQFKNWPTFSYPETLICLSFGVTFVIRQYGFKIVKVKKNCTLFWLKDFKNMKNSKNMKAIIRFDILKSKWLHSITKSCTKA